MMLIVMIEYQYVVYYFTSGWGTDSSKVTFHVLLLQAGEAHQYIQHVETPTVAKRARKKIIHYTTGWAPTSYNWSYNSYK